MNATSVDIKDMLEAESGLNLVFGVNLFVGREPSNPSDCVTIFDTLGMPPQLTFDASERYEKPSIQIRVRSISYTGVGDDPEYTVCFAWSGSRVMERHVV